MQEKPDYSKFISNNELKSTDEGITKENTPAELSIKDSAEQLIISYVMDGEYREEPYMSTDKILRIRIKDASGKIVYDNSLDEYITLHRRLGVNLTLEEIEKYHTEAIRFL